MAIKLTGPAENSVLIDANITEIILEHTDNQEHYHYAKFYIDNVLFDELVIPRISTSKLVLQFNNLLLKTVVFPNVETDVIQAYRMDRNLKIEIFKNKNTIATLVNTFNYVLRYSTKPTLKKWEGSKLMFIDYTVNTFVVSESTKILLPFYSSIRENIELLVVDNNDNILHQTTYTEENEINTFLVNLDINVTSDTDFYTLQITAGAYVRKKRFRVLRNKMFKAKSVEFYNSFGFIIRVDLFGRLGVKDEYDYTTFKNGMDIYKTADVTEETIFSVNTGYLTENERGVIEEMVSSLDLKLRKDSVFISCIPNVKSITTFTEGEFVTQSELTFKMNKNPKFKN